jgi:hypothetical protein
MNTKNESQLKKLLAKKGYTLKKSKAKQINIDDFCGYMIVLTEMNAIIAGSRFELTLEEVEAFLNNEC